MTMFAEPVLASAAEERMEGGAGACRREYAGYHQQHQGAGTPDHLRGAKEGGYPYPEPEDREVRGQGGLNRASVLPRVTGVVGAAGGGNQLTYPTHHQSQLRHVCSAFVHTCTHLSAHCSGHCYAEEEPAA